MSRTPGAIAAAGAILAAMLGLVACSGGHQQAGGRHPLDLKIADLVPLSGTEQPIGVTGQKAVNLAVDEIRRAIKTAKAEHKITITHANYRTDPKIAQDYAGKFARSGYSCMVGPWDSAAVIAVATNVSVPKKLLTVTPAASNDALDKLEIGSWVARTIAPDRLQGNALATTIAAELGGAKGKKVSIAALQTIYGSDLAASFAAAWEKLGGKVAARVAYESNLADYKKQAQELVAPKPDAYVFFDFQDTYLKVATELLKTGKWKPSRSFATDSLALSSLGQSGGATVEGLRGVAPGAPRFGPSSRAFDHLWSTGPPPKYRQPYDAQAFDATVLCYLSAVAAGSTKPQQMKAQLRQVASPPGKKYTWQQLGQAIRALEAGDDIDYEGVSGPFDMSNLDITAPGDPTAGYYDVYRYKNARLGLYASVSVPPGRNGIQRFPIQYVTPRIPGTGPPPKPAGPTGVTGAAAALGVSGASGAAGAKGAPAKKKHKKGG
jgi:ABC-type branched-subunit amino acid transport system substrate-binding protein